MANGEAQGQGVRKLDSPKQRPPHQRPLLCLASAGAHNFDWTVPLDGAVAPWCHDALAPWCYGAVMP